MIHKDKDTEIYKPGNKIVRITKHKYTNYTNKVKQEFINKFVEEYRRVMKICLNELWDMKYTWKHGEFCLKHNYIKGKGLPSFYQVRRFNCYKNYKGFLSGRVLSQILKDLAGILKGLYKSTKSYDVNCKMSKPNIDKVNPEIPPKHIRIIENENKDSNITHFIKLVNLTNIRNENITIPLIYTPMDYKFLKEGYDLMYSIMISKGDLALRYFKKDYVPFKGVKRKTLGADMGINKILTLSDGQKTPQKNNQGKTFDDIKDKLKGKKKGSKAFKRCLREIKVYIQEVMGKLDISDCDVFRLEHNKHLKKNTNNSNHNWSTEVIYNKVIKMCQDNQVGCWYTPPAYKSRRCYACGYVHKRNRNGEKFKCISCYHEDDADVNAAKNNSIQLPFTDLWSIAKKNKDSGFFWTSSDIYDGDQSVSQLKMNL